MAYGEILYGIWLSLRYKAADPTPGMLLRKLRTASKVYSADHDFLKSLGFSYKQLKPLSAKSLSEAEDIASICAKNSIGIIPYSDPNYPIQLMQTDSPPAVLYYKGRLPRFDDNVFVTAVGTRKMSDAGRLNAHRLCFELAAGGAVVVSGMARGNDSVCHMGALDGGGDTVAVLGTGVDVIYPEENEYLYGEILEHGAVISEFPPGTKPLADNFPKRNRIMAALGACTVIVEAGVGSGALITADAAMNLGRTVYAVPGPIGSPTAKGSNLLLKRGAALCTGAEDILINYELSYPHRIKIENISKKRYFFGDHGQSETDFEQISGSAAAVNIDASELKISRGGELSGDDRKIYETLLKKGAMTPEEFASEGIGVGDATYRLTMLEIGGYVTMLPGGKYTIR